MPGRSGAADWASCGFNEAAGVDPADARPDPRRERSRHGFNEAAGVDPADAYIVWDAAIVAAKLQ